MLNELDILKIVIKRLDSAGIPYMVSGSIAANFYTVPRMTRDVDIIVEVRETDAQKMFTLFSDDFYIDLESVRDAIRHKQMFNIIHNEAIIKVDFIIKKDSEYRKVEFERRRDIVFGQESIYITSPEDLIISKLYWAKESLSELQIRDVQNMIMTVPDLDMGYIEKWVAKLGLEEVYRKATK